MKMQNTISVENSTGLLHVFITCGKVGILRSSSATRAQSPERKTKLIHIGHRIQTDFIVIAGHPQLKKTKGIFNSRTGHYS